MKIYFYTLIIFTIIFSGCATKNLEQSATEKDDYLFLDASIQDLQTVPQDISYFTNKTDVTLSNIILHSIDQQYNQKFFSPWVREKITEDLIELQWPLRAYSKKKMFGQNQRVLGKEWFEHQELNANFENLNNLSRYAITVENSDMKNFPTTEGVYKDHSLAGEGYPFDYNQNTSIKVNTPIFISHLSKDRAWAYAQSPFAFGWINVKDIAFVDEKFITSFKEHEYAVATKDKFAVLDQKGNYLFYSTIGTIYPLVSEDENSLTIKVVKRDIDANGILETITISKDLVSKKPLEVNQTNLNLIANGLLNETYGWGGKDFQRDCSSTTQDVFAPFGIWLPRNSAAQAQAGKYLSLSGLTPEEKEKTILEDGVPFLTLIYLSGHIMIYVGEHEGKAIVYHNMWGVKTFEDGESGRFIVGKTVLTTLQPGVELENADKDALLINKLKGMVLLVPDNYALK